MQYDPFVYSAFVMATRPEILDCSRDALPTTAQRAALCPVLLMAVPARVDGLQMLNCSANEFKPELRFSLKKIYRAIQPRVIGWDAAS